MNAALADKANDYDGLWLFWWDLENPTEMKEMYDGLAVNGGTIVIGGGAAILEIEAYKGVFAIAFSPDYKDKDKALELFDAMTEGK